MEPYRTFPQSPFRLMRAAFCLSALLILCPLPCLAKTMLILAGSTLDRNYVSPRMVLLPDGTSVNSLELMRACAGAPREAKTLVFDPVAQSCAVFTSFKPLALLPSAFTVLPGQAGKPIRRLPPSTDLQVIFATDPKAVVVFDDSPSSGGTGGTPLVADLDHDGDRDGKDLAMFITAWKVGAAAADLNHNNEVDQMDVAFMAEVFGRL